MTVDRFYREFEEEFRGGRQVILDRLRGYTDFLEPLLTTSPGRRVVDLGCGRGEWLELTGSLGLQASGVDLDEGMLEDCVALGLTAQHGEAVAHLRGLDDGSQAVVSAFHLVEHVPFEVLQELVQEALRVLEPGGLLVMETPNPENLRVATVDFHLDPTHRSPLPPELLRFLPQHYGFARAAIVRLQEDPRLRGRGDVTLVDVLHGASPDYAVVAQKAADSSVLEQFDTAFARSRGVSTEGLAHRFEARLAPAQALADVRRELEQLRAQLASYAVERQLDRDEITRLHASRSWRVTAPMRSLARVSARVRARG